jgi:hypothetical protein
LPVAAWHGHHLVGSGLGSGGTGALLGPVTLDPSLLVTGLATENAAQLQDDDDCYHEKQDREDVDLTVHNFSCFLSKGAIERATLTSLDVRSPEYPVQMPRAGKFGNWGRAAAAETWN